MTSYSTQKQIITLLQNSAEWYTVGEVAQGLGKRPNTTIRTILDTLVFAGVILCSWGTTDTQHAKYYHWPMREEI
jgi:hypothetical protein